MEFNELFNKYLNDESFKEEYLKLSSESDYNEFCKKHDIPYSLEEMKTLIQDKIESANCGSGGEHERKIGRCSFSGHVGQYGLSSGTDYYFTEDGKDHWYYATNYHTEVVEYEDMFGNIVKKEAIHHLCVWMEDNIDLRPLSKSFSTDINGDKWTAYTNMSID